MVRREGVKITGVDGTQRYQTEECCIQVGRTTWAMSSASDTVLCLFASASSGIPSSKVA